MLHLISRESIGIRISLMAMVLKEYNDHGNLNWFGCIQNKIPILPDSVYARLNLIRQGSIGIRMLFMSTKVWSVWRGHATVIGHYSPWIAGKIWTHHYPLLLSAPCTTAVHILLWRASLYWHYGRYCAATSWSLHHPTYHFEDFPGSQPNHLTGR